MKTLLTSIVILLNIVIIAAMCQIYMAYDPSDTVAMTINKTIIGIMFE